MGTKQPSLFDDLETRLPAPSLPADGAGAGSQVVEPPVFEVVPERLVGGVGSKVAVSEPRVAAISERRSRAKATPPGTGQTYTSADIQVLEGVAAIHRKLLAVMESEGARPFESVGQPFDPREHEAVAQVPASGKPPGEVLQEHRKGWKIRDRILRPAVVSVAAD